MGCDIGAELVLPAFTVEHAVDPNTSARTAIRYKDTLERLQYVEPWGRTLDWGQAKVNITPSSKRIFWTTRCESCSSEGNERSRTYIDNGRVLARRDTEVHFCGEARRENGHGTDYEMSSNQHYPLVVCKNTRKSSGKLNGEARG